jgi:carboxylesterase type B
LVSEVEVLSGVTKNEGTLLAYMIFEKLTQNLTKTDLIDLMKALPNPGIDVEKASEYYLSNIDQTNQTALIQAFGAFYGDLILTCPTYLFAQQFAEYSVEDSVYFYEWTHRRNDTSLYACGPEWMGVCHGADLEFVFGVPFLRPDIRSDIDRNFSKLVMKLWTNFAKTGY